MVRSIAIALLVVGILLPLMIRSVSAEDIVNLLLKAFPNNKEPEQTVLQASAMSPDGTWVAERYYEIYPEDTDIQIALHRVRKSYSEGIHDYSPDLSLSYIPYKSVPNEVLFKWLDNSNLLIAAPHKSHLETKPTEFNGINLHYATYAYDPDIPRITASQKVFRKKASFGYEFEAANDRGVVSVGCFLKMTANDDEFLKNFALKLSAQKLYPHNEWHQKATNDYYVNIHADNASKQFTYTTGAKVEMFSPDEGRPLMGTHFKMTPTDPTPLGWDIVYIFPTQSALQTIIEKLKKGDFLVKVGFWLDNAEVVYSSTKPVDTNPIEDFESCIRENHIFDGKSLNQPSN